MPDRDALHTAVEHLAGRLRSLPQRRLRAGAASEGLALARWLAREAQLLEEPGREPRELPDDGVFVVGDQLAVAGHELTSALGTAGPDGRTAGVLAEALTRVGRAARAVG